MPRDVGVAGEAPGEVVAGERVALHPAIRLVARARPRRTSASSTCSEYIAPPSRSRFARHALGPDLETLDHAGEAREHEVERDRRVGRDHALDRRVADVALVPERHVLERGERVAAHQPREPADVLGEDRGSACAASPTSPSARAPNGSATSPTSVRCRWRISIAMRSHVPARTARLAKTRGRHNRPVNRRAVQRLAVPRRTMGAHVENSRCVRRRGAGPEGQRRAQQCAQEQG